MAISRVLKNQSGETPKDSWRTPLWLYSPLRKEFNFEIDAASAEENALCDEHFTIEKSAFENDWDKPTYCNPPYSQAGGGILHWVERGYEQSQIHGVPVVFVVPGDTSTKYRMHAMRFASEIRDLTHRVKFLGASGSPPWPTAIFIYRPQIFRRMSGQASVTMWNYKP